MPPAYIAQYRNFPLASAQSVTSTSFSPQAGETLVAIGMMLRGDAPTAPITLSDNTGGALTWTKQAEVQQGVSTNYVAIWTAPVASTQSNMTVTFQKGAATNVQWISTVTRWSGASGVGAVGSNFTTGTGQPSVSLTTQSANSVIVMGVADNTAIDTTTDYNEATAGVFTSFPSFPTASAFSYSFYAGYYADAGAAGAKTVGITYPNAQDFAIGGVELKGVSDPTVTAELWEGGSFKASLGTALVSADGVYAFNWDAATLTTISGANVELRLSSDLDMDVGAVEWNALEAVSEGPPAITESWGFIQI